MREIISIKSYDSYNMDIGEHQYRLLFTHGEKIDSSEDNDIYGDIKQAAINYVPGVNTSDFMELVQKAMALINESS